MAAPAAVVILPVALPPAVRLSVPVDALVVPLLMKGTAMMLVSPPSVLLNSPELVIDGEPPVRKIEASWKSFSTPPLLSTALPAMERSESRLKVPLMLRIRESIFGEAPARTLAVEDVEIVVTPGPSMTVSPQITVELVVTLPAPLR